MKTRVVVLLLLLLGVWPADARLQEGIPMETDSGVEVTVSCCFSSIAAGGFTPIDVTINNHSGATRRWEMTFSSPGPIDSVESVFPLSVENNITRTIPLLVPTVSHERSGSSGGRLYPIQISVTGYGAKRAWTYMSGNTESSGKPDTRFIVISESLGTPIWSRLLVRLQNSNLDLHGSMVKPDELSEDWRGLTSVAAMWLTVDELNHVSAAQRQAIQTWVRTGGQLFICETTSAPPGFRDAGFGRVETRPTSNLEVNQLAQAVRDLRPAADLGPFPKSMGLVAVQPNVALLGGFVGLFAAVVGPLNIFVLARRRRERLLWTTPLISIGASCVLGLIIVLQDGLGGSGIRLGTVHLFPESHNAVLIQKQISRTGLLLNSAFEIRDPVWMESVEANPTMPSPGRSLRIAGQVFDRNWFTSRALQAQRIVTVIPTRAEITVVNQSEAARSDGPVIVSSFEGTLRDLLYTDERNETWQGSDIHTGQKQTLHQYQGSGLRPAAGFFNATAEHAPAYLATVRSIRWKDEVMTYTGPVTLPH